MDELSSFQLGWAALIFTVGFAIRNLAGFGAILLPALALFLPLAKVVPVVTLIAVISSIGIAVRHRRQIVWRDLAPLVPWTLLGVALGLALFDRLSDDTLVMALGVFVAAFGLYSLWQGEQPPRERRAPRWLIVPPLATFAAVIGTTFGGLAGPVYGVYLEWLKLDKGAFRASMSALLVALGTLRGIGYLSLGFFDQGTLQLAALALPCSIVGLVIGAKLHARASPRGFRRVVAVLLTVSGLALLLR
ncbi:MAG: sulfite exporter TauE/SafE family protein [Proteobacteria bacterium]|nr:sulfite exporter TauE/SafE family protein [Burkholderiales bacterium]